MYYNNSYLSHHGILGMKWGVRRGKSQSGGSRKASKKIEPHPDYMKAHSKKRARELSDKDLSDAVKRLNMEKQYNSMTGLEVSRGKAHLDRIMKVGTTVAALTTTALTIYGNADKIGKLFAKKSG